MDWSKIERNAQIQTTARLQANRNLTKSYTEKLGIRHASDIDEDFFDREHYGTNGGRSDYHLNLKQDDDFQQTCGFESQASICNDIDDLKSLLLKQGKQIQFLEQALEKRDSMSLKQESLQKRIDRIEKECQGYAEQMKNLANEMSEAGVQAKSHNGRICWVEDMYRSSSQEFVTKATFSQLLTSCMDQLKDIHTTAENARSSGQTAMSIVESFLTAISSIQTSQPNLSLQHLMGLSSERQNEYVSRAIRMALEGIVKREMDTSYMRLRSVIDTFNNDNRKDMTSTLAEIREQITEHGKQLGEEVVRNTEISMKTIDDLSKQLERSKRVLESDQSALRESSQVLEIEQSEFRQALRKLDDAVSKLQTVVVPSIQRNHKSLVDEVVQFESQQSKDADHHHELNRRLAGLSEQMKSLKTSLAAVEKNNEKLKSDLQDSAENKENREMQSSLSPCQSCGVLTSRIEEIEGSLAKLSSACQSSDSNMDILQAELGTLSKDSEKKEHKIEKIKADLVIHKALVGELKKQMKEFKVKLSLHQKDPNSNEKNVNNKSDSQTKMSAKHDPQHGTPGPSVCLTSSIAQTRAKNKSTRTPQKSVKQEKHNEETKEISVNNNTSNSINKSSDKLSMDTGLDEDENLNESLSVSSPLQMSESIRLADSLDESLSSLTDHITPVKTTHNPIERKKLIKQAITETTEQGDSMIRKYEVAEDTDETTSLASSSSFDSDEDSAASGSFDNMASMISPKRNRIDYHIVKDSNDIKEETNVGEAASKKDATEDHSDDKKGTLLPAVTQSNKTQLDADHIGTRFDDLGNIITHKENDATEASVGRKAPLLSGSLLGRTKKEAPDLSSALTSKSIINNPACINASSRLALESTANSNRLAQDSSIPATRPDNTAQCSHCLKRMPVDTVRSHMKTCDLRTELCQFGCRSKILAIKMDKHLDICPKNPKNINS